MRLLRIPTVLRRRLSPVPNPVMALAAAGLSAILAATGLSAQTAGPPAYSADAIYRAADGTESSGRITKSGTDMRLEFVQAGRQVIQIIRRAEGLIYVLDPGAHSYYEIKGAPDPSASDVGYQPPCDRDTQPATCRFIGTEVTSGITAEVWEVTVQGQPGASTILWDGARHRALRQTGADGSVMSLTFQAMVNLGGRNVEHWATRFEAPGQPAQAGAWYYDPELRVEVREEMASGAIRALEEIRVGPVDPALFTVPAGWQQVQMPQAPMPPGSGN